MAVQSNRLVDDALHIYQEAVQCVREQKASRAIFLLTVHNGSFEDALKSSLVNEETRDWLKALRKSLCTPFTNLPL